MTDQCVDVALEYQIPDALWERARPLLPAAKPKKKSGRPRMDDRQALTAIFYVMRTGCQWKALPRSLGAPSTVHDRFQEWREAGVFERMWQAGLLAYDEQIGIEWEWQAMDGAMTKAPLGGKRNRSQSHRSRQVRHEAQPPDRRQRHSLERSGGWREPH
jgi:transposase